LQPLPVTRAGGHRFDPGTPHCLSPLKLPKLMRLRVVSGCPRGRLYEAVEFDTTIAENSGSAREREGKMKTFSKARRVVG